MKKIKILFQGDSITDAGRDRRNYHHMGNGYAKYASELIRAAYPDVEFEFINFGISGNRSGQLFDRIYLDGIAFQPDIMSILIGVNDVWHRYNPEHVYTTDAQYELNYRCTLDFIREKTNAKLLLLQPYTLNEHQAEMRDDVVKVIKIADKIAEEYADGYIRLDEIMRADENHNDPTYFSFDGVHPNQTGAQYIAKLYLDAIKPMIDEIIAKQ